MILIISLSAALSVDLFTFGIGYGISGVRIPSRYCALITFICVGVLSAGAGFRCVIVPYILPVMLSVASCVVLSGIGLIKIFQTAEAAGTVEKKAVTFGEAVAVGFAVSADGFAAGLATEIEQGLMLSMVVIFAVMSYASAAGGNRLGFGVLSRHNTDKARRLFDKGAGVVLVLIGISRLVIH